jgi:Flp pilus assembly protein TadB
LHRLERKKRTKLKKTHEQVNADAQKQHHTTTSTKKKRNKKKLKKSMGGLQYNPSLVFDSDPPPPQICVWSLLKSIHAALCCETQAGVGVWEWGDIVVVAVAVRVAVCGWRLLFRSIASLSTFTTVTRFTSERETKKKRNQNKKTQHSKKKPD